jgi:hypothetical protein
VTRCPVLFVLTDRRWLWDWMALRKAVKAKAAAGEGGRA